MSFPPLTDGSFRFLQKPFPEATQSFWEKETDLLFSSSVCDPIWVGPPSAVGGAVTLNELPWESRVFNRKMGKLSLISFTSVDTTSFNDWSYAIAKAVSYALAKGYVFLSSKVYCSQNPLIHGLQKNGFLLVDTMLDFVLQTEVSRDLGRTPLHAPIGSRLPDDIELRAAVPADLASTLELARLSFTSHFGRFQADPYIALADAENVYTQWIKSSYDGYADRIFVAAQRDKVVGCTLWKDASALERKSGLPLGHYSLGAVHPEFAGKGLFSALTRKGVAEFSDSLSFVEGPTHVRSLAVQGAYLRMGWKVMDSKHSFHLWLKP